MTHHIAKYIEITTGENITVNWFNADSMNSTLHNAYTLEEVHTITNKIRNNSTKLEHKMIAAAISV